MARALRAWPQPGKGPRTIDILAPAGNTPRSERNSPTPSIRTCTTQAPSNHDHGRPGGLGRPLRAPQRHRPPGHRRIVCALRYLRRPGSAHRFRPLTPDSSFRRARVVRTRPRLQRRLPRCTEHGRGRGFGPRLRGGARPRAHIARRAPLNCGNRCRLRTGAVGVHRRQTRPVHSHGGSRALAGGG